MLVTNIRQILVRPNLTLLPSLLLLLLPTVGQLVVGDRDATNTNSINRLLVVTATNDPDADTFKRFNQTVESNGLDLVVLGPNSGSGPVLEDSERLERLRKALLIYKNEPDLILLIVDSWSTLINGNKREILDRFANFKLASKIVFAADATCWPDAQLESLYPNPPAGGYKFLNSELVIGYAPFLWDLLNPASRGDDDTSSPVATRKSDGSLQTHCTNVYLNAGRRVKLGIELDHQAKLFQILNSSAREVELDLDSESVRLRNTGHDSEPLLVHGSENTDATILLNSLGNYLAKAWTIKDGCRKCNSSSTLPKVGQLPVVLIGLFVEEPTPFIEDFFLNVRNLDYPKKSIHLFVHNSVEYHNESVGAFISQFGSQYAGLESIGSGQESSVNETQARTRGLERCVEVKCDYYLALDSVARIERPDTLRILIETNQTILAPLLSRPGKLWSNFWGALSADGHYARSHDYIELVKMNRLGVWNVPHVMHAYLVSGKFIQNHLGDKRRLNLSYFDEDTPQLKPALSFTRQLRKSNIFMFMINTHEFGHLVDPTSYNTSLTNPDFYQLTDNMEDWEAHYLHDNFTDVLEDGTKLEQPCQDVFWFPLVSDKFCSQLIEIMETHGRWSGGTNDDPRIEGGYESVPTRDIHMKQVGLHEMWLTFLREYVMPVQLKEYIGYEHDPPRAELAFVVRYHPAEQPSLRPHHDSSTYTLNIALNTPRVDYQGGGCRFVRYNCSVIESRRGWALLHPGRLTHYHEGLPVTNGTRYIMVTFVDP